MWNLPLLELIHGIRGNFTKGRYPFDSYDIKIIRRNFFFWLCWGVMVVRGRLILHMHPG